MKATLFAICLENNLALFTPKPWSKYLQTLYKKEKIMLCRRKEASKGF